MLIKLPQEVQEVLNSPNHGTLIDGVLASAALDTSGESLDVAGADISSMVNAPANSEHQNPDSPQFKDLPKDENGSWSTIVGRIVFVKKIFQESDCASQRELSLWNSVQLPFIYGAVELFDNEGHRNAQELASIIKHYYDRGLPLLTRYSIEGSTLERKGNLLKKTLCRRVAITCKPCNHSAVSNLVAPAAISPEQSDISKTEKDLKYISVLESIYNPWVQSPEDSFVASIRDLHKTLTLGGGGTAPGSLTSGAALATEDVGKKYDVLKNQIKAAIRDWDGIEDFKKFLKFKLPDVDDEFIDKFTEMAHNVKFKKIQQEFSDLTKVDSPQDLGPTDVLRPLNTKLPPKTMKFRGKHICPGEIELVAGPFQGNKLKLLYLDDNYAYVQPFQAGDKHAVRVNKLNRNLEGSHFIVSKEPETLDLPNYVHGDLHTDPALTKYHEQKQLVHGMDFAKSPDYTPRGATEGRARGEMVHGVFRSAHDKQGFVKPAVVFEKEEIDPKAPEYLSTAKREVIFHNIAKSFFGLGMHVPTTALIRHPDSNHEHSAQEIVLGAEHIKMNAGAHEGHGVLQSSGISGQLDKLAIMDRVMGASDRHRLNYMVSPKGTHLIDNSLIFDYSSDHIPAYLTDFHQNAKKDLNNPMHPEAIKWAVRLSPIKLQQELLSQGVHPNIAGQAVSRLLSMQSAILLGNNTINDLLFAYAQPVQPPTGGK